MAFNFFARGIERPFFQFETVDESTFNFFATTFGPVFSIQDFNVIHFTPLVIILLIAEFYSLTENLET